MTIAVGVPGNITQSIPIPIAALCLATTVPNCTFVLALVPFLCSLCSAPPSSHFASSARPNERRRRPPGRFASPALRRPDFGAQRRGGDGCPVPRGERRTLSFIIPSVSLPAVSFNLRRRRHPCTSSLPSPCHHLYGERLQGRVFIFNCSRFLLPLLDKICISWFH